MPSKALLVIDMQRDLCYDVRRKRKIKQLLPLLQHVIDAFTSAGQPVFFVCFSLPPDDEQFQRFGDVLCIEGTQGAEVIPELLPLKGTIIKKRKHSAFFETELDRCLKEAGVTDVYLSGLQTQICIMTTAADASFRGYQVAVIRECVVSTREMNKKRALEWIARYVGEIVSVSDVLQEVGHE